MLDENDVQQSPSYSIKRDKDYIHAKPILKSPLFSAHEEFTDDKTGLKVIKENSPNCGGVLKHQLCKFAALQYVINRNLDIILLEETKLDDLFPSAQFM